MATKGSHFVMVYIPTGIDARLNLKRCDWKKSKAWWYNCRTGEVSKIGRIKNQEIRQFSTPTQGRGNDWVLVLDNVKSGFKAPGKSTKG